MDVPCFFSSFPAIPKQGFSSHFLYGRHQGKRPTCELLVDSARGGGGPSKKRVAAGVTGGIVPESILLFVILVGEVAATKVS